MDSDESEESVSSEVAAEEFLNMFRSKAREALKKYPRGTLAESREARMEYCEMAKRFNLRAPRNSSIDWRKILVKPLDQMEREELAWDQDDEPDW